MPPPLLIFSQSGYLVQIVDINLHTEWQTVQIQFRSQLIWIYTVCKGRVYPGSAEQGLTFTMLWVNSADNKLTIFFFLFFLVKRILHFMQIVSLGQFAWSVRSNFLGKTRKIFQNVVCWNFNSACKVCKLEKFMLLPAYMSKNCWMREEQRRPWSDTTFCSVWSKSTPFAKVCMCKYLGKQSITLRELVTVILHAFLSSVDFFFFFSKKNLSGIPSVSNSMDPDQAERFVRPDLNPNCLQRLSVDDKSHH